MTAQDAISIWLSDDEHLNTMLSPDRSDIGAAVAVSDQIYVVLETALGTPSRQHQGTAYRYPDRHPHDPGRLHGLVHTKRRWLC